MVSVDCSEIDLASIPMASRTPVEGASQGLAWMRGISYDVALPATDVRTVFRVAVERPPAMVRSDVRHGPQADIGWKLGRLAGVFEGLAASRGIGAFVVEVSEHRATMVRFLADRGVYLPKERGVEALDYPWRRGAAALERDEVAGGTVLHWHGCGHKTPLPLDRLGSPPPACPTCTPKPRKLTRAEAVRDDHKRRACAGVRSVWPEPYQRLVDAARERARSKGQPDHRLAGVSDACEAVWTAVHLVQHGPT